jgi:15-cis-phytoene synthase
MSAADAAFCADLVRSHDFDRYASTLFVDTDQRRALLALHAFDVEVSRIRHQVSQPLPGEIRLQWWTDMLEGIGHGGIEGNPVAAELKRTIAAHDLPVEPLLRLIEAHHFDLYNDPMPDLAALEAYLADTVSTLFSLGARVMREASGAGAHLARHAGLAQGMARVVANLPLDAARRQLFVPLHVLERHGGTMEEVFARQATPQFRATLDELIGQGRAHLDTAFELLAQAPATMRPLFLPLALVRYDLKQLSRAGADPFAPRPRSRLRTLWTLWRASRAPGPRTQRSA